MTSYENAIFQDTIASGSPVDSSAVIEKKLLYVSDNNASMNYSTGQIIINGNELANNGLWIDYVDSYLSIPLVIQVNGTTAIDMSAVLNDFVVGLKNCNTSLIHSASLTFGNSIVHQHCPHINMYAAFKQHTTLSAAEEELIGPMIGYARDNADSWSYRAAASTVGVGLCNNSNGFENKVSASLANGSLNEGMFKRQRDAYKSLGNTAKLSDGKHLLLGDAALEQQNYRDLGISYATQTTAAAKYIYLTALVRVKDIFPIFSSPDFPRYLRSGLFSMNIVINQPIFQVTKGTGGILSMSNLTLQSNGTNPLMFAASYAPVQSAVGASATDTTDSTKLVPCGSACLPLATYQASCCVVKTYHTHAFGQQMNHNQTNVRWYTPAYKLNPTFEAQLLSQGQKSIKYDEVYPFVLYNVSGNFSQSLTTGITGAKQLVIVPVLGDGVNGNASETGTSMSDIGSCFSTSGSTTAPTLFRNFNVTVGGVSLFSNGLLQYGYENYIQEMMHSQGFSGNVAPENVAGRISLKDFTSGMYGYVVVNLSRVLDSEMTTLKPISISGQIASLKAVNLHCFIVAAKPEIVYDVATGQRLS